MNLSCFSRVMDEMEHVHKMSHDTGSIVGLQPYENIGT